MDGQQRRGRPSKLTPDITAKIIAAIGDGNYLVVAARCAGVSDRTLHTWIKLGKQNPDSIHGDFLRSVRTAETHAESVQVKRVYDAAMTDPKWALEWLKRKAPHRWGQDRLDVKDLRSIIAKLEKRLDELSGGPAADAPEG